MLLPLLLLLPGALAFPVEQSSIINDEACDPLVPEYCAYPFPNNFYTAEDDSTPTGLRVNFPLEATPKDLKGQHADPTEWNKMDGFSPLPTIQTYFNDVSSEGLPSILNVGASMTKFSPTVLLDAETLEWIPHFVELDWAPEGEQRAFMIWPAQRLESAREYIVAVRYLKTETDGSAVEPSEAFRALRDRQPSPYASVERRREKFEEMFASLENVGVERQSLQLAWSFTVASRHAITNRLVSARDDAFSRVGDGPELNIVSMEDDYNTHYYRKVELTVKTPMYLNTARPVPSARLVVDDDENALFQGYEDIEVTVLIPRSLVETNEDGSVTAVKKGAVMQYGHGLFGSRSEVEGSYLGEIANREGYIMIATDWWGMMNADVPAIALILSLDLSNFIYLPDRSVQGFVNAFVAMRMAITTFGETEAGQIGGESVVDVDRRYYYGNSQGGIYGGVYMAASQDVTRGCLGVPGAPYSMMLPRSIDFDVYSIPLKIRYPDRLTYMSLFSYMEVLWVRAEPAGFMDAIVENPLPGTPEHNVLFQYAIGDSQVHQLATYGYARSTHAAMFESQIPGEYYDEDGNVRTETLWGFDVVSDDTVVTNKSAMVGWDYAVPPVPMGNQPPPKEWDTHGKTRRERDAQDQMARFFATGEIVNTCGGPCTGEF